MGRCRTYIRRYRYSWLNSFVAGVVVLSQLMLIIGANTSFAQTDVSSRVDTSDIEFPFGPMIICTPNGIQIIYPNGDGPDGQDGEGKIWVKCPLCLIASAPFLLPPTLVGGDVHGLTVATDLVWAEEHSCSRSVGRYINQPARAPPFGHSV